MKSLENNESKKEGKGKKEREKLVFRLLSCLEHNNLTSTYFSLSYLLLLNVVGKGFK
jgi:hypothetical protein